MKKKGPKRFQLFEFTDLKWCPDIFRTMATDFMQAVIEKYQPYSFKLDLIAKAVKSTSNNRVIDLCSGSFGPWLHLKKQIEQENNKEIEVVFTDKYPSPKLAEKLKNLKGFTYSSESVDAKDVPNSLNGTRTIFNGLHHFPPQDAQKIIENSIQHKQPIIVFEILQRSWNDIIIVSIFTPFYILLFMPFFMKISLKNIFFTYILPIFPLMFTWETIISNLRCYKEEELIKMLQESDKEQAYTYDIGSYRCKFFPVLYLIAYPATNKVNS